MRVRRIPVRSASGTYPVFFGRGAWSGVRSHIETFGPHSGIFVLSSRRVWRHWGGAVLHCFQGRPRPQVILLDDRETAKRLRTVERICERLARAGADRRALLVGVGGGVVGDVAGFAAATYQRGVSLVHVPTTLVAQVDSALGGKTGVNLPQGKNLVGAFYPPHAVLADPMFLRTLGQREYRSGLYEVIKYGVICDRRLFEYLEKNLERLVAREDRALSHVIPRCIAAKAAVVSRDEREAGLREALNYGHTVGHALEAATGYRGFLHGEAVGWGMIAAALLGLAAGVTPESDARRIVQLIARVGRLPSWPRRTPAELLRVMRADKKTRGGRLRFVLARKIGRVETVDGIPESAVARILSCAPDFAVRLPS